MMSFLQNYYMYVVRDNDKVLHLRRNPTWRSLLLFSLLWTVTHFLSVQAQYPYLGYLCYALGIWFCYLSTEKYEECIFDKEEGTVQMMNARFLQKWTIGYNRKIVSQLKEVIGVTTMSVKPTIFGRAHQVTLLYVTGLTLSITASATYGNKTLHREVANKINSFLKLPATPFDDEDEEENEILKKTN